jgi:hypothetical protein
VDIIKELANFLNQLAKALIQFGNYLSKLDPRTNLLIIVLSLLASLYFIVTSRPIWKIVWTFIFAILFHQVFWLLVQIEKLPKLPSPK